MDICLKLLFIINPADTKHFYNISTTSLTLVQRCINVIQMFMFAGKSFYFTILNCLFCCLFLLFYYNISCLSECGETPTYCTAICDIYH